MKPLVTLTATAAPLQGNNIDTDRIIPARLLRNPRDKANNYSRWLFHDLRFNEDGSEISDFVLNQDPFRQAKILVAGENFGCGSSRESAVYALSDAGFRAVIAPGFGDIFYANCVRNGVAPLRIPKDNGATLRRWLTATRDPVITIDLKSLRVTTSDGQHFDIEIPEFERQTLMLGQDAVELTLKRSDAIDAFEKAYLDERPWLNPQV